MKEFEFDDIEISDEVEEQPTEKVENLKEDPLYQKFSFDIDSDDKEEPVIEEVTEPVIEEPVIEEPVIEEPVIEEPIIEEQEELDQPNINNLFEEKEEPIKETAVFSNTNEEIDNPFLNVQQPTLEEEKKEESIFEEATKDIKPIISYDEKEIENKEDALEEALSHTTKLTPFKNEKPVINDGDVEEVKEGKESNGIAYLIILFIILLLAIFVIPKIASLLVIK